MADGTYHTKAQVQSKFKSVLFGTSSKVTETELESEIARTEAYVEGKIDPFYAFASITSSAQPKAFVIVTEICLYITIAKVNEILRKNGVEQQNPEEKQKILNEYARAEKMLKGIGMYVTQGNVEGAFKLPDGTMRALPTSNAASGIDSTVDTPQFKKGSTQW